MLAVLFGSAAWNDLGGSAFECREIFYYGRSVGFALASGNACQGGVLDFKLSVWNLLFVIKLR